MVTCAAHVVPVTVAASDWPLTTAVTVAVGSSTVPVMVGVVSLVVWALMASAGANVSNVTLAVFDAALAFPAASDAAPAPVLRLTNPSAVGVTRTAKLRSDSTSNPVTVPLVTTRSSAVKPATASLNATVNATGAVRVGPLTAAVTTAVGAAVSAVLAVSVRAPIVKPVIRVVPSVEPRFSNVSFPDGLVDTKSFAPIPCARTVSSPAPVLRYSGRPNHEPFRVTMSLPAPVPSTVSLRCPALSTRRSSLPSPVSMSSMPLDRVPVTNSRSSPPYMRA